MSKRLPRLNPDEIIRVAQKLVFSLTRQSGSHRIYKNEKEHELQSLTIRVRYCIPRLSRVYSGIWKQILIDLMNYCSKIALKNID